jgi:formylglycine-generating enzyme required for sulfatase activity/predicted esterase
MNEINSLFDKLKKNSFFKAVAGYAVFAFVIVQVASLVSDTFNLNQQFMKNLIWVFIIGFPFLAIIAWAASSRFSTFKILGIFLFVLATGYGSGSYLWVNTFMMPQIKNALESDDYVSAWIATNTIDSFAPFFSSTKRLNDEISTVASIKTEQDGVSIYWRPYLQKEFLRWEYLGTTEEKEFRLPNGIVELKFEKEGYETLYLVSANPSLRLENFPIAVTWSLDPIKLQPKGSVPEGMIYIPGGPFIPAITGQGVNEVYLHPYYIDKNEITNIQFKEFIDAGGYNNPQFWVEMEIVKEGVTLLLEEAKKLMIDSTGLNGPANWEVGMYLEGQENYPVTGITWYEALAYARFRGNILPPMHHWAKAAYPPDEIAAPIAPQLLPNSNFGGKGLNQVGTQGLGPYGTYDMAGNAREWVWNIFGGVGLSLGGAFSDPVYTSSMQNPLPRFDRSPINGFRTVRLLNPRDMNPFGDPLIRVKPKPLSFYKPMNDEVFKIYSRNFEVGPMDMNAQTIYEDTSNPLWDKERITVELGYNSLKMDILIFKPKESYGKLESIVFYPGANYYMTPPDIDEASIGEFGLDFIIKSGRAVVWPAIKGSMNRLNKTTPSSPEEIARLWREGLSHWTVDTYRTLDYLQSRPDFDDDNIFYVGMSHGALFPTHTLLFEKRFKAAILYVGGVFTGYPPLSDGLNHIPRINTPILMLNGEQDYLVPKISAETFYNFLGTSQEDKKIVFYDSGHWPLPRNQMIKETLAWVDKYSTN